MTEATAGEQHAFDCTGPFGKDASHGSLAAVFGARSVVFSKIEAADGSYVATVVFPNDPRHRLEITWKDERQRRQPALITAGRRSALKTPHGIGIGASLEAVEKINGRPFTLAGFAWDYEGTVTDWKGGTLAAQPNGCRLIVRFAPTAPASGDVDGDRDFASDDPAVRHAQPAAYEIVLSFD